MWSTQAGADDLPRKQAHWFRMDEFWSQAARMVKPGGTVALWTQSSLYCRQFLTSVAA